MGSSAMGATKFRNCIKEKRPDLVVTNTSVDTIPSDCNVAVVQITLVERAKKSVPNAQIVTINNFLADPALDALYERLTAKRAEPEEEDLPQKAPEEEHLPQMEPEKEH